MNEPDWALGLTLDDLDDFTDWWLTDWYSVVAAPAVPPRADEPENADAGPAGST